MLNRLINFHEKPGITGTDVLLKKKKKSQGKKHWSIQVFPVVTTLGIPSGYPLLRPATMGLPVPQVWDEGRGSHMYLQYVF